MNRKTKSSLILIVIRCIGLIIILPASLFAGPTTHVWAVDDIPPIVGTSSGTTTYIENAAASPVDPNITVTEDQFPGSDPTQTILPKGSVSITGGYHAGEDFLEYTTTNGITGTFNPANGVLSLSGNGTAAAYQAAFRAVKYYNTSDQPNTEPRTITFVVGVNSDYFSDTNHYYSFIESHRIQWSAARAQAAAMELYGMHGYLATITSQAEHDFIRSRLPATDIMGWIGSSDGEYNSATDTYEQWSTADCEGNWRWVTGPEGLKNSTSVCRGTPYWTGAATGSVVNPPTGTGYANWSSGEPNNSGNAPYGEDFGHVRSQTNSPNNQWNDLKNNNGDNYADDAACMASEYCPKGFMVEFGDMAGDTPPKLADKKTVTVVAVNDPPSDITLDNASVAWGQDPELGVVVGLFSTTDPDSGAFTYELVPNSNPAYSADNTRFQIDSDMLLTAEQFPATPPGYDYHITVRSTDDGNPAGYMDKHFIIHVIEPQGEPPVISGIPSDPQHINEDASFGPITINFSNDNGAVTTGKRSSNTTLVPLANITLNPDDGSLGDHTLTVTPSQNKFGSSRITIIARDSYYSIAKRLELVVDSVNDNPVISNIPDKATNEDTPLNNIPFSISDIESDAEDLIVTGTSSNQNLVPDANLVFGGVGTNRTLSITPVANQTGTSTITVRVTDPDGGFIEDAFEFNVVAVNDPARIAKVGDPITEAVGQQVVGNQMIDEDIPLALRVEDVDNTSLTFNIKSSDNQTLVPDANIVTGAASGAGTPNSPYTVPVTITPALNQFGSANITLEVTDGTNITTNTFKLTVNSVNDPPTISAISNQTVNEDATTPAIPFTISDVESDAGSLTLTAASSNQALVTNSNIILGGSGSDRTITITPLPNAPIPPASNQTTISITARDPNGGQTVQNFTLTVTEINDPPQLTTNKGNIIKSGETVTITNLLLKVDDIDDPAENIIFSLVAPAPQNGTLRNNGAPLGVGGTFTQADINNNLLTYVQENIDNTNDSFTFTVSDGRGGTIGNSVYRIRGTVVTSVNDSGGGSLRQVITNAQAGDEITFEIADENPTILLTSGPIVLNKDLVITGPAEISGSNTTRVFQVNAGVTARMSDLTIENGAADQGAGLLNQGTLTLTSSDMNTNHSTQTGGAILNSGALTLNKVGFASNIADQSGGAISNTGELTITNSTFANNRAIAGVGGAIYNEATLTLSNDTFVGNQATASSGGAIHNQSGMLTINSITAAKNAAANGGGIKIAGGTAIMKNSLLSANTATTGPNCAGPITSKDYNLIKDVAGCVLSGDTANNIVGIDPLLAETLANNNGETQTLAILNRSIAYDAGSCTTTDGATLAEDQREVARPQGDGCDIGAYESQSLDEWYFDDRDPGIIYNQAANWKQNSQSGAYENTISVGNKSGSTATFQFRGSRLSLLFWQGSGLGKLEVKVDGVVRVILPEKGRKAQRRWNLTGLDPGMHTLVLRQMDKKPVNIDAIITLRQPINARSGLLIEDSEISKIAYHGFWQQETSQPGASNGTITTAYAKGDTASLKFNGNRITVYYWKRASQGTLDIGIDGKTRASIVQGGRGTPQYWSASGLSDGEHTITFTNAKSGRVNLDALVIYGNTQPAGAGVIEDNDLEHLAYNGVWATDTKQAGATNGTITTMSKVGSSVSLTFTGDRLTLWYWQRRDFGSMDIKIDGVTGGSRQARLVQRGDLGRRQWNASNLGDGTHTLTLTDASGTVNFDAIEIFGSPVPATVSGQPVENQQVDYLAYEGNWQINSQFGSASGSSLAISNKAGDTATLKFTGDRITLFYWLGSKYGNMNVQISGLNGGDRQATLNLKGKSALMQWSATGLGAGSHVLTISNPKNTSINIDSILISSSPLSGGIDSGKPTIENNQTQYMAYDGNWLPDVADSGSSEKTLAISNKRGDVATLQFTGDRITIQYWEDKNYGTMGIKVDGVDNGPRQATLKLKGSRSKQTWVAAELGTGTHTLTLTNLSGVINFDRLVIDPTPLPGIPGGTVEDSQTDTITYQGNWQMMTDSQASGGTETSSRLIGDTATLKFTGERLTLQYFTAANNGIMGLRLENVSGGTRQIQIDQKGARQLRQWSASGLGSGQHKLVLTHIKGSRISLDSILIANSASGASTGVTENEDTGKFTYSGHWQPPIDLSGASGGKITRSLAKGDTATLNFTGDRVTLLYWQGKEYGNLGVQVGPYQVQIDQKGKAIQRQWSASGLGSGVHTLTLTNLSGGLVNFDAVIVDNATISAASGKLENSDTTRIAFTGAWQKPAEQAGASGGTITESITRGDQAVIRFTGDRVTLYYWSGKGFGSLDVSVGSHQATINQKGSSIQQQWSASGLGSGEHTLTLTNTKGGPVNFDALVFDSAPTAATIGTLENSETGMIAFNGLWQPPSALSGASGGTITQSLAKDDQAIIQFTGDRITLLYWYGAKYGTLDVQVDSQSTQIVQKGRTAQVQWMAANLGAGTHTLTLTNLKGGPVNFDAVIISGAPTIAGSGTIEDNDFDKMAYSGKWQKPVAFTNASGGTITNSNARGDTATLRFSGDRISILYWLGSRNGIMDVMIQTGDGQTRTATFNQRGGRILKQWSAYGLGSGTHTLTLTNKNGFPVNLDAIIIRNAVTTAAPGKVENDDLTKVAYAGAWVTSSISGTSGGNVAVSNGVNETACLTFNGSKITLYYWMKKGYGSMLVQIDGNAGVTINESGKSLIQKSAVFEGLGSGVHTITITHSRRAPINIDAFEITP